MLGACVDTGGHHALGEGCEGFEQAWEDFHMRVLYQTRVGCMRQVCAQAGVLPSEVAYVEAHGTGTVVGDAQVMLITRKTFPTILIQGFSSQGFEWQCSVLGCQGFPVQGSLQLR